MITSRHRLPATMIVLLLALFLAACRGNPEPARDSEPEGEPTAGSVEEVGLEEEEVVTPTVPAPTAEPEDDRPGGSVIIGSVQAPASLNPLLATVPIESAVTSLVFDGLVEVDAGGTFIPVLAEALPEVSEDGRVVTYRLREGLVFSNNEPVTCDDVRFTWQAIISGYSYARTAGYREIEQVECPDDRTVVVTFKEVYAPYLRLFNYIVPREAGTLATMNEWDLNRNPVGTGPWILQTWQEGDALTFVPNPHYRKDGQPYLDSVTIKFLPSREAGLEALETGEITALWGLTETAFPRLEEMAEEGVTYASSPTGENELLLFNLANPAGNAPDNPDAYPHPILHDGRVRLAIQLAIDKDLIVTGLLGGHVRASNSVLPSGQFACSQDPAAYDPQQARALLAQAGWQPGADGIRMRNGQRLTLTIQTITGNKVREDTEELLAEMLQDVGIELEIDNMPSYRFFADWDADGLRKHGRFDILLYTTGPGLDPARHLFKNYHSSQIPVIANAGEGANYSRYVNEEVDQLIEQAATSTDIEERQEAYCEVADLINRDVPRLYLYERLRVAGYRETLQNFELAPGPAGFAVRSETWLIEP